MSGKLRVAVPSVSPGGMESNMSEHFGRAECFTVMDIDAQRVTGTRVITNPPHEHGGCLAPVQVLKQNGVHAIIVGGIGARPLAAFRDVGIDVIAGASGKVSQVMDSYLAGRLRPAGDDIVCGHSKDGGCSH